MLRQFLHIMLTVLMLASTFGVTIKKHYCLGEFRYASLNVWSLPCCSDDSEQLPPCCSDEFEHYQIQDEFQGHVGLQLELPDEVQLPFLVAEKSLFPGADLPLVSPYQNYKPPLLYEDRRVRLQSFLI